MTHPSRSETVSISEYFPPETSATSQHSELQQFLNELEEQKNGIHHQPFTTIKQRIRRYQTIFFGLGFLFILLGYFVYHKTSMPTLTILFQELESIKGVICSFCGALATGAWAFGLSLRSHRESVRYPLAEARQQLASRYRSIRAEKGWHAHHFFGEDAKSQWAHREQYRTTRDLLVQKASETSQILFEIKRSSTLSSEEQEQLSNEAMLKLSTELHSIVSDFPA